MWFGSMEFLLLAVAFILPLLGRSRSISVILGTKPLDRMKEEKTNLIEYCVCMLSFYSTIYLLQSFICLFSLQGSLYTSQTHMS